MAYKYFAKTALVSVFAITSFSIIDAQGNDSLIQKKIKSQQYFFELQACSSSYVTMPINSLDYGLSVTTDSIIAVLPYNGQSYAVTGGRSNDDKEIRFISTNFRYSSVAKKKGKWEITIEPNDAKGIRLYLVVFSNGKAEMEVISPGKETMSFNGYVW